MMIQRLHREPVAQLDRASAFEAEGREFESLRARHSNPLQYVALEFMVRKSEMGKVLAPVLKPSAT